MLIGCARVSTTEQNIESQIDALREAGCKRIFADRDVGGDTIRRPELNKLNEQLREDDIIVFTALGRLARNVRFLLEILETIKHHKAGIKFLSEPIIDTTTPVGEFALQIFRRHRRVRASADPAENPSRRAARQKKRKDSRPPKGVDKGEGGCHRQAAPTRNQHCPTV